MIPGLDIQTLMEIIQNIRRVNLQLIRNIAEYSFRERHGQSRKYTDVMFSEYIGISQPLYSLIKNDKKNVTFTEKTARKIELNIKLPINWLDVDYESDNFEEIVINGSLILKLMLEFKTFLETDNINFNNNSEYLENVIGKAIQKTSKYQDISSSDFISLYFKNEDKD